MTRIVRAASEHIGAVLEIERAAFSQPWTYNSLLEETQAPQSRFMLAADGARVLGYAVTRYYPDWAEILRIAVAEGSRGRGVGSMLLGDAQARACESGASRVLLEARADNAAALEFYRNRGFITVGLRAGYYASPGGDAVLMEKSIAPRRGDIGDW
ncbi:MAG: ribosomal protein S18-alanine N-acetyltransferase [Oscillospiraceae bacterium]|jgi:ribosomal-protein-alanine acetyltransferase|nr:ribosomal protein S18-alanine N-acetyltransferase [Oscillospiraceae bacterium]